MSEIGQEIIASARKRVDLPFRHHFKPINECRGGAITLEACMRRGMDKNGYDCTGLVIACLCDVLAVSTDSWPRSLRHTQQLAALGTDDEPSIGDLRLYISHNDRVHIGIVTTPTEAIHASGVEERVVEGIVTDKYGEFRELRTIRLIDILPLIMDT